MQPAAELLARVVASAAFARSKRHAEMLQFLVERQEQGDLKESVIGCEFFGRPADYNPKLDPVVRVEIRRLRERLAEYYGGEGSGDAWRLEIPKGSYRVMVVESESPATPATSAEAEAAAVQEPQPSRARAAWRRWAMVAVGALALAGIVVWMVRLRVPAGQGIESIAVLPLTPAQARDSEQAETILNGAVTNALARIGGLRVIGPDAALRAQAGGATDAAQVASELGVEATLAGEWALSGRRIRLQLRMCRGRDGQVLWARTVECERSNPFGIQDEVARSVAAALRRNVVRQQEASRSVDAGALLAFERGNRIYTRRSEPAIREAIREYQRSVALDANFAAAWAALADALSTAPDYLPVEPGWADRARAAARKAIELDPDNAEAYAALGWTEFAADLHATAARAGLERAVAINPNLVAAHRRLGMLFLYLGQNAEAARRFQTALRLDPLSEMARINMAELQFYSRDYAAERHTLEEIVKLNPHLAVARVMLTRIDAETGRCPAVLEETDRLLPDPDASGWGIPLACLRARCGDNRLARTLAAGSDAARRQECLCLAMRDRPRCREWLQRLEREQPVSALNVLMGPDGPDLRKDPAIEQMYAALNARLRQL